MVIGHGHLGTVTAACLTDTSLSCARAPSVTGGVWRGADMAIVSSSRSAVREAWLRVSPHNLSDLSGRLDSAVGSLPVCEGIGW